MLISQLWTKIKTDNVTTHPIQWRMRALGEYSLALPPNLFKVGPHGHSLEDNARQNAHQVTVNTLMNRQII